MAKKEKVTKSHSNIDNNNLKHHFNKALKTNELIK